MSEYSALISSDTAHLFNSDGYFANPWLWDRSVALRIARVEGLSVLTEKHWRVINQVRGQYFLLGSQPAVWQACRMAAKQRLHANEEVFGNCHSLWRVAGLPDPGVLIWPCLES
jgi:tRNA 2-thiouridine synthesizing protein E